MLVVELERVIFVALDVVDVVVVELARKEASVALDVVASVVFGCE